MSNFPNRERKRKHQALEVEEKEVEDRFLVDQLELKLKQRCKGMALVIAKGLKTGTTDAGMLSTLLEANLATQPLNQKPSHVHL